MGLSEANYDRIRIAQQRIKERRAARALESGRTEPSGEGRSEPNGQPTVGEVAQPGPVQDSGRVSSGTGSGLPIPTAETKGAKVSNVFKAHGYVDAAKEVYDGDPHYAKPNRVVGWIANRIGKRFRPKPKEKTNVEPLPSKPNPQDLKFNASTANLKGIIAAVAVAATVLSGLLGKQIMIDDQSITTAVNNIYAGYMGVLAVVAAVTYIMRVVKNVYGNWQRITQHGVKISGPNADLSFDFGPKDNGQ